MSEETLKRLGISEQFDAFSSKYGKVIHISQVGRIKS